MNVFSKFIYFHSRKSIWKYLLENGGHFVSASIISPESIADFQLSIILSNDAWQLFFFLNSENNFDKMLSKNSYNWLPNALLERDLLTDPYWCHVTISFFSNGGLHGSRITGCSLWWSEWYMYGLNLLQLSDAIWWHSCGLWLRQWLEAKGTLVTIGFANSFYIDTNHLIPIFKLNWNWNVFIDCVSKYPV